MSQAHFWVALVAGLSLSSCGGGGNGSSSESVSGDLEIKLPEVPGWGTAQILDLGPGDAVTPQLEVNANGDALAIWHQREGTIFNIWARQFSSITGTWAAPVSLDTCADSALLPSASGNRQSSIAKPREESVDR
jgi:hypothetical protein